MKTSTWLFSVAGLAMLLMHAASFADTTLPDVRFLNKAAEASIYELEGSQLALKKSHNPDVQKFATEMVKQHSQASTELRNLMNKKKLTPVEKPSYMQKGALSLLESRSGKEFDEDYARSIGIEAHESVIELFTNAAADADDAEIKKFAAGMLPTLRHHLEMARTLNDKINPKVM